MPGETEAVISDFLSSELSIVILDARRGLWCLRDELGRRESAELPLLRAPFLTPFPASSGVPSRSP
ncbi:hypothetical protein DRO60_05930 [Candidatus Bathyarchaeota archaeon]|nr:MAG: hypothetical protein DRO60_05930 [Candidatus Bathyarchaeota archaeon]